MGERSESVADDLVLTLELWAAVPLWRGSEGSQKIKRKREANKEKLTKQEKLTSWQRHLCKLLILQEP